MEMERRAYRCSFLLWLIVIAVMVAPCNVSAAQFDYQAYERILDRYVFEGKIIKGIKLNVVDYEGLYRESRKPSSDYAKLLEQLSRFSPEALADREEQIAFWINAYNIGAIKMILDHYPVDSIKSTKINLFKNPWNKKILTINGAMYSLGEIEHEILLGRYREKMAHFAIVCASLSCPDIVKEVYRGATLKSQLERQARLFLNNPGKGYRIDRSRNIVYVSKIFKWDKKNFGRGVEDIIPFIIEFVEHEDDAAYLKRKQYTLDFLDYDWDLNTLKSTKK